MRGFEAQGLLNRLGLGAAVLAAAATAGCFKPTSKPDLTLPAAYEAPQGPQAGYADLDRWWLAFDDPNLTALIDTALARSPTAREAIARLQEARAVRGQTRATVLPTGDLAGRASKTHTDVTDFKAEGQEGEFFGSQLGGDTENYAGNFNVSWEIDIWGKSRAGWRVANADYAAARFAYEGARASLAAQVADAYFQLLGLDSQRADAEATRRIQASLVDVLAKREQHGLIARSEVDRAGVDLAQAEAELARLTAEQQATRRALLILVGRAIEPTANLTLAAALPNPPSPPAAVPGDLMARRPDVREAGQRLNGALGRKTVAERTLFPSFTLLPGAGISRAVQPSYEATSQSWTLGVGVNVPVLSIPRLLAQADQYGAQAEQAAINYEQVVQTAYGEAESALVRLDAAKRQVDLLTVGEGRAQRAYDAAQRRYTMGLDDLTAVLSAEQAWRGTRTALTAARVQAARQAVQAFKALGGGWTPAAGTANG